MTLGTEARPTVETSTCGSVSAISGGKRRESVTSSDTLTEDIQVVPLDEEQGEDGGPEGWTQGRTHFTRVALKVLSNVILKDKSADGEVEVQTVSQGNSYDEYPKRLKGTRTRKISDGLTLGQRSSTCSLLSSSTPLLAKRKESEKRPTSLASVVGLVTFRKLYPAKSMALPQEKKNVKEHGEQKTDGQQDDATEELILPEIPRFSSKLSTEAQFAMLKGYEDKLVGELKRAFPDQRTDMVRVLTPSPGRRVKGPGSSDSQMIEMVSSATEVGLAPLESQPTLSKHHPNTFRQFEVLSQLRVSGQFETAMDILDQLGDANGHHIISPRMRYRRNYEPVKTYNAWIHRWAKQFKLDSPETASLRHAQCKTGSAKRK